MQEIYFATQNEHKAKEINALLGDQFQIKTLADLAHTEELAETATTLEGNALQKARYIAEHYKVDCFADDTGLEVMALDGAPGVYSARYAGAEKSAEANMNKLLTELSNKEDRSARFRTVIALILDGEECLFEGIVEGQITHSKRGNEGFGYDPIFLPDGYEQTFAEMDLRQKGEISHRGRAIRKLQQHLNS